MVVNPYGSFPLPDSTALYRMGPLFTASAVDFLFNTQQADGTFVSCAEPPGWEGLDFNTPLDQAGGRDGALIGPQSIGPKTLDIAALFVSPTASLLRRRIAALRTILTTKQPVIWEQYDFGSGVVQALVTRPVGKLAYSIPMSAVPGGVACAVTFSLVANTPVKYLSGAGEFNSMGLLNQTLITGRTYDKTYSYNYGLAGDPGGTMTCVNQGDANAFPVFTVTGPVNTPVITDVSTGQSFQVNAIIPAGNTVVIDSASGSVTPSSIRLIGRPFTLAPGPNTIRWTDSLAAYDPAASLRLDWRSTYQ